MSSRSYFVELNTFQKIRQEKNTRDIEVTAKETFDNDTKNPNLLTGKAFHSHGMN